MSFSSGVLDDDDAHRYLDIILALFEDGRHRWVDDLDAVTPSTWFRRKGGYDQKRIKTLSTDPTDTREERDGAHRHLVRVTHDDRPGAIKLSPSDAATFLGRPVVLLVENIGSDGLFLSTLLRSYSELFEAGFDREIWRSDVLPEVTQRTMQGKWLSFDHGGGSTTHDVLARWLREPLPPPIFTLVDSDADRPGQSGSTARAVYRSLKAGGSRPLSSRLAVIHQLALREAENYLPNHAITAWVRNREQKRGAARALQAAACIPYRGWYDMKAGFHKLAYGPGRDPTDPATWAWQTGDTWLALEADLLLALRDGLGDGLCMAFDSSAILAEDFEAVAGKEPREIIEKIISLL